MNQEKTPWMGDQMTTYTIHDMCNDPLKALEISHRCVDLDEI